MPGRWRYIAIPPPRVDDPSFSTVIGKGGPTACALPMTVNRPTKTTTNVSIVNVPPDSPVSLRRRQATRLVSTRSTVTQPSTIAFVQHLLHALRRPLFSGGLLRMRLRKGFVIRGCPKSPWRRRSSAVTSKCECTWRNRERTSFISVSVCGLFLLVRAVDLRLQVQLTGVSQT